MCHRADTSNLVAKAALKLDVDKLKTVPNDVSKSSSLIDKDAVKKDCLW